jgi:hypothetical protein
VTAGTFEPLKKVGHKQNLYHPRHTLLLRPHTCNIEGHYKNNKQTKQDQRKTKQIEFGISSVLLISV